jgi:hypothetical protein
MADQKEQYVSLRPEDAVAGGFLADLDVIIRKARFEETTYRGTRDASCALIIGYEKPDDDELREQIYSVGDLTKYTPSEDGTRLVPQGGQKGISKTCNAYIFLTSLWNNGWPQQGDKSIGIDISILEGAHVHVDEVPPPARKFKEGEQRGEAKNIVVVTKINHYPWEAPKEAAKGKASGAKTGGTGQKSTAQGKAPQGAPAAAATSSEDAAAIDVFAQRLVLQSIIEGGGTIAKPKLVQVAFKAQHPKKPVIVQKLGSDPFLNAGAEAGLWSYDGTTVSQDVETATAAMEMLAGS